MCTHDPNFATPSTDRKVKSVCMYVCGVCEGAGDPNTGCGSCPVFRLFRRVQVLNFKNGHEYTPTRKRCVRVATSRGVIEVK